MKKRIFFLIALLCFLIPMCANAFTIEYDGKSHEYTGNIFTLNVDGKIIDTPLMPPIVINGRTLVPIRELCEALGSTVEYNNKIITIDRDGDKIIMTIDKNSTSFNGQKQSIPDGLTPKLINFPDMHAKTMVPARYIAETLGKTVEFDSKTDTVLIYGDPYSEKEEKTLPTITYADYTVKSGSKLTITVEADKNFKSEVSSFTLDSPTRVVFDIPQTNLKLKNNTLTISESCPMSAIRFGHDGVNKTRVVIDVNGKVLTYKASTSGDTLTMTITAEMSAAPTPTPTPDINDDTNKKPVVSPSPTPTVSPSPTPGTLPSSGPLVTPDTYNNIGQKIIVIDAGHGGEDPGAVSDVLSGKTVLEKDIALGIAKKVRDILENNGYTVIMTRPDDTYPTLNERAKLANQKGAALFVSIHMNSSPSQDPSGTETYYSEINNGNDFGATSKDLATNIQNRLYKALNSRDRGVKTANHAVTRNSIMPAALIEVGFISNAEQAELLTTQNYQNKAAQAIAEGITKTWQDIKVPSDWTNLVLNRVQALNASE